MRIYVPYASSGPRPRAVHLGDLGCACTAMPSAGLSGLGAAADWQVNPRALNRMVAQVKRSQGLSGLGVSTTGFQSAASGASTGATIGSAVPIVGTAVGAVVGAIAGYLLGAKNYFNVGNSNAQCQQLMQAWQQYTTIQGHVAGRALGWSTMQQLFHAAVGAGLFPGNDMHLKFHEGTLQCAGHGDWVDDFLGINLQGGSVNNCGAHNCMADALAKYQQSRSSVPARTPDAIFFVDSILLPMNESAQIPWVYNGAQNPQVHQLFYDTADAYLAQYVSGTTPYVEYPQAQTGTPTVGAEGAPVAAPGPTSSPAPVQPGAPSPSPPTAVVPYVPPASAVPVTSVPTSAAPVVVPHLADATADTNALIQSLMAQGQSQQQAFETALASLQANGVNVADPGVQQQVAGAVAAAAPASVSSLLSGPTGMLLIALGVGGAIVLGMRGRGGRRR